MARSLGQFSGQVSEPAALARAAGAGARLRFEKNSRNAVVPEGRPGGRCGMEMPEAARLRPAHCQSDLDFSQRELADN